MPPETIQRNNTTIRRQSESKIARKISSYWVFFFFSLTLSKFYTIFILSSFFNVFISIMSASHNPSSFHIYFVICCNGRLFISFDCKCFNLLGYLCLRKMGTSWYSQYFFFFWFRFILSSFVHLFLSLIFRLSTANHLAMFVIGFYRWICFVFNLIIQYKMVILNLLHTHTKQQQNLIVQPKWKHKKKTYTDKQTHPSNTDEKNKMKMMKLKDKAL